MTQRARLGMLLALGFFLWFSNAVELRAAAPEQIARLIVYDVRGSDAEETTLILDQSEHGVRVWLKNYLGQRSGEVPPSEFQACFQEMLRIPKFALKPEYQGRPLRSHAARGTVTLAWKNHSDKQIKTIRYYAPEHTLDDFRQAFNHIWALSRYAILSHSSLESPKLEYREDAVYFLSGSGWLTSEELDSVMAFHRERNLGENIAHALWSTLDQQYPAGSEFAKSDYRSYCVRKSMVRLGQPAVRFLQPRLSAFAAERRKLAEYIIREIRGNP